MERDEGSLAKGLTYSVPVRLWGLATAKVAESPGRVAQHTELAAVAEQVQQRLQSAAAQDVVTALWAVASNVSESPNSLLAHIRLRAGEELDKDGNGTSLNDNLGLGSASRCNVGKSPCSLELDKSMRGAKELDETANDAGLDDLFDGRVAFFG